MYERARQFIIDYAKGRFDETTCSLGYVFRNKRLILIGGLAMLSFYIVIGMPLIFGYLSRCMREILAGNRVVPPFNNKRKMYKDGLCVGIIGFEYLILVYLVYAIVSPWFYIQAADQAKGLIENSLSITGKHIYIVQIALTFVFGVFFNNAWLMYIVNGRLSSALNPISTIRWMISYPNMIFSNVLSTGILGMLLAIPGIFLITAPWISFIGFVSNAYIRADSYEKLCRTMAVECKLRAGP